MKSRRGDLDPLLAVWQVRREHARAQMIEYFDGGRYPRFVEAFTTLLDDPGRASLGFIDDDGEARPHRVAHVLPAVDSRGEVWTHFYRQNDTYSRVDHILVSPALRPAMREETGRIHDSPAVLVASDHRPVSVTLDCEGVRLD